MEKKGVGCRREEQMGAKGKVGRVDASNHIHLVFIRDATQYFSLTSWLLSFCPSRGVGIAIPTCV